MIDEIVRFDNGFEVRLSEVASKGDAIALAESSTPEMAVLLIGYRGSDSDGEIVWFEKMGDEWEYGGAATGSWFGGYPGYLALVTRNAIANAYFRATIETPLGVRYLGAGLAGDNVVSVKVETDNETLSTSVHPLTRAFVYCITGSRPPKTTPVVTAESSS